MIQLDRLVIRRFCCIVRFIVGSVITLSSFFVITISVRFFTCRFGTRTRRTLMDNVKYAENPGERSCTMWPILGTESARIGNAECQNEPTMIRTNWIRGTDHYKIVLRYCSASLYTNLWNFQFNMSIMLTIRNWARYWSKLYLSHCLDADPYFTSLTA